MFDQARRSTAVIISAAAISCLLSFGCDEPESISIDVDAGSSQPDAQQEPEPQPDAEQQEDADVAEQEPDAGPEPPPPSITALRYEKIIHHVEGPDNRVEVEWSDEGVLTITRPPFMTHPGTHEFELSFALDEQWELSEILDQLPESSEALAGRTRQRMEEDLVMISDPDTSVLEIITDDLSQPPYRIEAAGVQFWSTAYHRDTELAQLAQVEEQIWDLMATLLDPDLDD